MLRRLFTVSWLASLVTFGVLVFGLGLHGIYYFGTRNSYSLGADRLGLAFDADRRTIVNVRTKWLLVLPLAAAFLAAADAIRRIPGRPTPPGLCPACGYDLRAEAERDRDCGGG